jgi:hypothetical protein
MTLLRPACAKAPTDWCPLPRIYILTGNLCSVLPATFTGPIKNRADRASGTTTNFATVQAAPPLLVCAPQSSYFSEKVAATVAVMVFSSEVVSLLPSQLVAPE